MKILTVSALVCALMALTTADGDSDIVKRSASCPDGWLYVNGRCFAYLSVRATWDDAKKKCVGFGGNLASVQSVDEYRAIQSKILEDTPGKSPITWLGGYYAQEKRTWVWSDGSSFRFANWAPGQPDYRGKCLTMNNGGEKKFASVICTEVHPYICAKKA